MSERSKYCDKQCWDEGKCSGYCAGDGDPLPVTAGWAALNTLRERCPHMPGEPCDCPDKDAAFALLQTALEAAEHRVEYGHNDTCDLVLSESENYPCTCGQDKLAAALRAVREGK